MITLTLAVRQGQACSRLREEVIVRGMAGLAIALTMTLASPQASGQEERAPILVRPAPPVPVAQEAPLSPTEVRNLPTPERPPLPRRGPTEIVLCVAGQELVLVAMDDEACSWIVPGTAREAAPNSTVYVFTLWTTPFQPGPAYDAQSRVGWLTTEITFDCSARVAIGAAVVSVHDPEGRLLESRRQVGPEATVRSMWSARQIDTIHRYICSER
jgi:hypothetical protein